jgi:hypothetical protein
MVPGHHACHKKRAQIFRPYLQLGIQIVPNFFGRYQNLSKGK